MVKKMKKEFARFKTNGFLLDFLVKSLEIVQKENELQLLYQRFVKEDKISTDEYEDTYTNILEDILSEFHLNNELYSFIKNKIKLFFSEFNKLKLTKNITCFSQEMLDKSFIEYFIYPFIYKDIIKPLDLENEFLKILPSQNETSIQKVFKLFNINKQELKNLLEDKKILGYSERDKLINNWLNGKNTPNSNNIDLISTIYDDEKHQIKLITYLKMAKILDYLYKKSLNYFGENETIKLIASFRFMAFLENPQQIKCEDKELVKIIERLYEYTDIKVEKTQKLEKETIELFKEFEDKFETKKTPFYHFFKGRYFAQKREYKTATKHYVRALESGKNCIGFYIKHLIKEGLFVSAQETRKKQVDLINAKSNFTKFYKEAYFYKLLDDLPKEINLYFLNDMKQKFNLYFTNLYPNVKKANQKDLLNNMGIYLYFENENKVKPDFKKPNKKIKISGTNPESQLSFFAGEGEFEIVKKLVEAGADVNYKRDIDNYTTLIATLKNKITPNHIKIAKFLIAKMNKELLDAKHPKKKETALSYAIQKGNFEIVEELIEYNCNLNQKVTLDELTPLYLSLQMISKIKKIFNFNTDNKFRTINPLEDEEEVKKIINMNNMGINIFDDEKKEVLKNISIDKQLFELAKIFYHTNLEVAYKIFDLVLENTKNVDIECYKIKMTPLIYATELNETELVKKLLKKGANKNHKTIQGAKAYDYAFINKNYELMKLLK